MGPVSASIEIDVPRQRIFEEILDLSRRPSFMDHFLTSFHLTRIDPVGIGAGARFRFDVPLRKIWMDTTIVEAEGPGRIVERGRGGRVNRVPSSTVWEIVEGPGPLSTLSVSFWTETRHIDRALDALTGASVWHERAWKEALRRLRDALEEGPSPQPAVAVAGGNAHATGIP